MVQRNETVIWNVFVIIWGIFLITFVFFLPNIIFWIFWWQKLDFSSLNTKIVNGWIERIMSVEKVTDMCSNILSMGVKENHRLFKENTRESLSTLGLWLSSFMDRRFPSLSSNCSFFYDEWIFTIPRKEMSLYEMDTLPNESELKNIIKRKELYTSFEDFAGYSLYKNFFLYLFYFVSFIIILRILFLILDMVTIIKIHPLKYYKTHLFILNSKKLRELLFDIKSEIDVELYKFFLTNLKGNIFKYRWKRFVFELNNVDLIELNKDFKTKDDFINHNQDKISFSVHEIETDVPFFITCMVQDMIDETKEHLITEYYKKQELEEIEKENEINKKLLDEKHKVELKKMSLLQSLSNIKPLDENIKNDLEDLNWLEEIKNNYDVLNKKVQVYFKK